MKCVAARATFLVGFLGDGTNRGVSKAMSIVCGTDFTDSAQRAAQAAAGMAVWMNTTLHLVHSVDASADALHGEPTGTALRRAKSRLHSLADRARGVGAEVEIHVAAASPDDLLHDVTAKVAARLIVVASGDQQFAARMPLSRRAERLSMRAQVPVLVVRSPEPFAGWLRESRALRILLGLDTGSISNDLLHCLATLRDHGPCEIIATQLETLSIASSRLAQGAGGDPSEPSQSVAESRFVDRVHAVLGRQRLRARFAASSTSPDRLSGIADEEQSDLIVVQARSPQASHRAARSNDSPDVKFSARVVVAPSSDAPTRLSSQPARVENVVVATDFSETDDAAVALASCLVAERGTLHLIHIVEREKPSGALPRAQAESNSAVATAQRRLRDLATKQIAGRHRTIELRVLQADDVASGIHLAAETLNADVICLGTQGRSQFGKAVLGPIASSLMAKSTRPVLLARSHSESPPS